MSQVREFDLLYPEWNFTYFVSPRCVEPLRATVRHGVVCVPFRRQPGYAQRLLWEQVTLPHLLRTQSFDLVSSLAGLAIFRAPIPQVVTDHNSIHHASRQQLGIGMLWARARIERIIARQSARRADAVIYLTHAFTQSMMRVKFPTPAAIIPSGVSVNGNQKPTIPSGYFGKSCGEPASPLACNTCRQVGFALAVHNWYPHKRLEWLIQSWPQITAATGMHLVTIGGAVGRRQIRARARALAGIRARQDPIVHVLDSLPHHRLLPLYQSALVYVSASVLEAFPLTPFEAMAAGVPCVLSDIATHREIAGPAAEYFISGRADSLLGAITQALDGQTVLTQRGLRRIENYQWSYNTSQYINVFAELLSPNDLVRSQH